MFVYKIKDLRIEKKMTIYRLSKLTKISRSYLIELENNKKTAPSLKVLYSIAEALNVNVKELFYTKFDLETLRKDMHEKIDKYGLDSKEVLEISQLIDLIINLDTIN